MEELTGRLIPISIHAPRVRCDYNHHRHPHTKYYFNPRTSCEVRRNALRPILRREYHFNPRTSCEVRRDGYQIPDFQTTFQSTHLVWGATELKLWRIWFYFISIHAPRVRCDILLFYNISVCMIFQSTHLVWGATTSSFVSGSQINISIHAPRVRCDYDGVFVFMDIDISIHAPRVRCDIPFCSP